MVCPWAREVQIADGNTSDYFLTTFGRAKRESVCSCEVMMEPNLSQALALPQRQPGAAQASKQPGSSPSAGDECPANRSD